MNNRQSESLDEEWEEENDSFIGRRLNKGKKEAYDRLLSLCRVIRTMDRGIRLQPSGIDERERNAWVRLCFPVIVSTQDKRMLRLFAELFSAADDAVVSKMSDGVLFSLYVENVWAEYSENGVEHIQE